MWCEDCNEVRYAWGTEPPTACPVDAGHSIDENSIVVVERGGDTIESIHWKLGWHMQQIVSAGFSRPNDLLVYDGWLNSFNSAVNGWDNEKVAQDMARYDIIVLGDGLQSPSHGDWRPSPANTECGARTATR